MLSNIGSKQRFPCQQFRAPSQPVTLQSASFGYSCTDSRSLCLEKLKLFIKVHTRVLKHRQECDRWVQRTSPYPHQTKNSRFHYSTCDVSYWCFFWLQGVVFFFSLFPHFLLLLWLFQPWEMKYRMPLEQHLCLLQFFCGWWYYLMFCCIFPCAVDGYRWFSIGLVSDILHTYIHLYVLTNLHF